MNVVRPQFHRAFTLLEVLVSIAIFAMLISAIGSVFYAAIRMRNSVTLAVESTLPVEDALDVIRHDLSDLVAPNGLFCGQLQNTSISNALPGQIGPDFYSAAGELDGMMPWGNIEKLDYVLAAPTNGATHNGKDLYCAITHNLLPVTGQTQPDERRLLLSGVQSLTFAYYDGLSWEPNWDTSVVTNLPVAIKVQLQMSDDTQTLAKNSPLELIIPMDILVTTNRAIGVMQ